MTTAELLDMLARAGAAVWADGDQVRVRAPKGVVTPALRSELASHKLEILTALRGDAPPQQTLPLPTITPRLDERFEPFPLTDIQQAYWVGRGTLGQGVGMHAYLEIDVVDLDLDGFGRAWNALVARHEMLRAIVLPTGQQRILEQVPEYAIACVDLRERDTQAVNASVAELRHALSHQLLPLETWPLFDLRALRTGEHHTRLCISVDATCIDAWSFQVLIRDLVHLYRMPDLPLEPERLDLSFRDYVLATRDLPGTEAYAASLKAWRERLQNLAPAPDLPLAARPEPISQLRFQRLSGRIEGETYTRLRHQASTRGLTLPGVLLAAYGEVLGVWSGSERLTINVPVFNRLPVHPQVDEVVGTFSSFTLVEVERRADTTFAERARNVQDQLWNHLEQPGAEVGGVQLLRELMKIRGSIDGALMPVVFTSFPRGRNSAGSYWLDFIQRELGEVVTAVTQTPQVWIDHQAIYADDAVSLSWDVAESLFPDGMPADMFAAYQDVLRLLASHDGAWSNQSVVALPAAQTARRARTNATQADIPGGLVHRSFFERAVSQPDRRAVLSSSRTLTYAELARQAEFTAHRLRRAGVRPNQAVAIVMDKSWEQVVAVLGALRAGSPYLPIDPALPLERMRYLLRDGDIRVVLTQSHLLGSVSWPDDVECLVCPREEEQVESDFEPLEPLETLQTPDDLAAIIYTSGSTGTPNGVMLTHRGVLNAIADTGRSFHVGPSDSVLALTALHHDMSMFDIFGLLSAGGTVVIPDAGRVRDPSHWLELMQRERVTIWNSVPAMLAMLVEYVSSTPGGLPDSLRLVFSGGDWIPLWLPDRLRHLASGVHMVSVGGPTETTLWNIWYPIDQVHPDWPSIPYGRPIANTRYFVLNQRLEDCPEYVPGELCCAGVGVAGGYWHNPEKTAQKFVTHPRTGERIYRTGDRGRFLPGGTIEFLGRLDTQISLRGHRIEPGEIESTLTQHTAVQAAVVTTSGSDLDRSLVVHVVPRAGQGLTSDDVREFLQARLPPHMVPVTCVIRDELPLSRNGKIDRQALASLPSPHLDTQPPRLDRPLPTDHDLDDALERALARVVASVLGVDHVETTANFFDLGANSIHLVQVHVRAKEDLGLTLPILDLFQHPNVAALARSLNHRAGPAPERRSLPPRAARESSDIAIIGMSGRFPGARTIEEFWDNLAHGREGLTTFEDDALLATGVPRSMLRNPSYVKSGGPLEDIDLFDAEFFGMSRREAQGTDPQNRLFLEVAWEALESAGYAPETAAGRIGVYAGKSMSNYRVPTLAELKSPVAFFQNLIGNDKDFLATQVSYKLNLNGPSLSTQTACSTSLVAVALACQGLLSGACDMALAGGISLKIPHRLGYLFEEGSVFSPDGHCRPFDARAQGTVPGSGAGIVVLKRLTDAVADRDPILAVIKGSAINNDGAHKVGFSAPSVGGQSEVIAAALERAAVDADSITYVEAHGTGTPIGDPIEVAALTQVFRASTARRQFCALGSVKSNVGHLDSAAGVAGLIKTVLALQHRMLPPSLNFEQPNPRIDFKTSPFYVNTELTPWDNDGRPLRAGVSSFGIGGTNAHVVLEEAPRAAAVMTDPRHRQRGWHAVALSARTEAALNELTGRYAAFLGQRTDIPLSDVCYTANTGRRQFEHRLVVVSRSNTELRQQLVDVARGEQSAGVQRGQTWRSTPAKIAFLFTGQGSQYVHMGRGLYESEPIFRNIIDRCDALLRPQLECPLLDVLYPPAGGSSPIDEITYAQPVLFAVECALAAVWRAWGIEPAAVLGHSTGEFAAACVAGVFSLEDGLRLVAARARLMEELALVGDTLAVFATEKQVLHTLRDFGADLSIAAVNGPSNVAVSGTPHAIAAAAATLAAEGIESKKLNIPRAAHSPLMDPILPAFARAASAVTYTPPTIAFISNLTGRETSEVATPEYWSRQVRGTVRFADCLSTLAERGHNVFIEAGPKPTLIGMARQCLVDDQTLWLPSLRSGQDDWFQMLESLGNVHIAGVGVDWGRIEPRGERTRRGLPTYPFQRQRYWDSAADRLQPNAGAVSPSDSADNVPPLLGREVHIAGASRERRVFEAHIAADRPAFLAHHRVFGTTIVPATALCEMALEAAVDVLGISANLCVRDVLFQQALILPENSPITVQCLVDRISDVELAFEIFSLDPLGDRREPEWIRHASGSVSTGEPNIVAEQVKPEVLLAECQTDLPIDEHYARAREGGIDFGVAFRGLVALRRGRASGLGRIEPPEELASEMPDYFVHPALLDACLQVLATTFPELEPGEAFLPIGLSRLQVFDQPGRSLWSRARLCTEETTEQSLVGDIDVFGPAGEPLMRFEGLRVQRSSSASLLRSKRELLKNWLYEVDWRRQELPEAATSTGPRGWLILADRFGIGQWLADRLSAEGDTCVVVSRDHLDTASPAAYASLWSECQSNLPPARGVIYAWGLDAHASASDGASANCVDLGNDVDASCASLLLLLQAILLVESPEPPRLYLLTADAQGPLGSRAGFRQAALWGMGQVIANEHPELHCARIDLDLTDPLGAARRLGDQLLRGQPEEDQVAFRGDARHVARLVRAHIPAQSATRGVTQFAADATYCITGGLGRLGPRLARWLVDSGARHVLLVARHRAAPAVCEELESLRQSGAEVSVVRADVTDEHALARVLADIPPTYPLRGILHAPGVLDDGVLTRQTPARFASVLAPKVRGAWNVHLLTRETPLDFFVVFSSAAVLLGSRGQASHAAANAFLDALAEYRLAQGLPCLSINWGPWAGLTPPPTVAGTATGLPSGLGDVTEAQGLAVLEYLLGQRRSRAAVLPIDWPRADPELRNSAFLADFRDVSPSAALASEVRITRRLQDTPPEQRLDLLRDHVRGQVARILGLAPSEPLDTQAGLFDLGLDSLASLELRNRLQLDLDCPLPSTLVFNFPTVDGLTHYLASTRLTSLFATEPSAVQQSAVAAVAEDLSEDEIATLLAKRLAAIT